METGPDLSEEHVLADGTRVTIRHIRPEDAEELRRGFERLSPQSRYRRFLGGVTSLSDEQLRYLTQVDGHDHVALVATTLPEGATEPVGLGVARYVRAADEPAVAEAAITVQDEVQGRGIGRLLGLVLARAALERGVTRFRGEILADNEAVRGLLADVGASVKHVDGVVVFDLDLEPPPSEPERGLDVVAHKLLRAAATFLAGLFGGLRR
jgi:GNAT superfamily N-acetyltransferase